MASDIVERLRDADTTRRIGESYADTHERRQRDRDEAADEIERLRTALTRIADTPFSDVGSVQSFAAAAIRRRRDD